MSSTVFVREYSAPKVDIREILRYAGCRGEATETEALVKECLQTALPELCYRVCWCELYVRIEGELVVLGGKEISSASLAKQLFGCQSAVIFAATVGLGLDRLISKYSRISPARALCLQAIGAERVEALCDAFCFDLGKNKCTRPRFSPGYGDLSLELQGDVCEWLSAAKHIGVGVNESLLLSPSKSVTAIVGIEL